MQGCGDESIRGRMGRVAIYYRPLTGDQSCERQERDLLALCRTLRVRRHRRVEGRRVGHGQRSRRVWRQ